jgi:hypothetical protein
MIAANDRRVGLYGVETLAVEKRMVSIIRGVGSHKPVSLF